MDTREEVYWDLVALMERADTLKIQAKEANDEDEYYLLDEALDHINEAVSKLEE